MQVLVVEDRELYRDILVGFLSGCRQVTAVDTAPDGRCGLEKWRNKRHPLVLLDILMPQLSGLRVLQTINQERPGTRVAVISARRDPATLLQLHQLQPWSHIDKHAVNLYQLRRIIANLVKGTTFVSETLTAEVQRLRSDPDCYDKLLTRRELEILKWIGGGYSDAEIGLQLNLRAASVQVHRRNLLRKLNCPSSIRLMRKAQELGLWMAEFHPLQLAESYHILN